MATVTETMGDGGNDIILDFGNGEDRMSLWAFEDIQSVDDLTLQQQGDNLLIDLIAYYLTGDVFPDRAVANAHGDGTQRLCLPCYIIL